MIPSNNGFQLVSCNSEACDGQQEGCEALGEKYCEQIRNVHNYSCESFFIVFSSGGR